MASPTKPAIAADTELVVAGAGPVGLSLALGVARRGHTVVVLEKEPGTAVRSRAPAIWPRTQEVLAELGVIERFLDEAIAVRRLELFDVDRGQVLVSLPFAELADDTDYPQLLVLPQSRTEKLLLDALEREPTADVRFDHEVLDFEEHHDHVRVLARGAGGDARVRGRFLAGCDGAHSTVRDRRGIPFEGRTYAVRAGLADIEVEGEEPPRAFPRLTTDPRLAIGIRLEERRWRLILPFSRRDVPLQRRASDAAWRLLGRRHRCTWHSEFRLHRRLAKDFADGRVLLAGDAAHLNSPVGGQGMNAGIQDAHVFAQALSDALREDSVVPLRRAARARRREVHRRVNRFTDRLTRVLLGFGGRGVRPTLRIAGFALRLRPLRRRVMRRMAMLDQGRLPKRDRAAPDEVARPRGALAASASRDARRTPPAHRENRTRMTATDAFDGRQA